MFLALNSLEWTVCVVYKKGQMHDKHWYCNAVPKLRLFEYKSKICKYCEDFWPFVFLTVTKLWLPRQRLSLQSVLPLHRRNHLLRGSSGSPPQCGGKYPKTLPGSHRRCKVVRCSFVFTHSCRLLLVLNEWIKSLFLAVNKLFSLKTYIFLYRVYDYWCLLCKLFFRSGLFIMVRGHIHKLMRIMNKD